MHEARIETDVGTDTETPPETKDFWVEDETMRVNLGPQHPSTHGVLRLRTTVNGEIIVGVEPIIGYLHTGIEKQAETLNWIQAVTDVTRADYLSNFYNELAYCLAVEKLSGIEAPPRAQWIRLLMCEFNRISSHLVWLATGGMELGAMSMATFAFREREHILDFYQAVTGLRMNHAYFRPGGVAMDFRPELAAMARELLDDLPKKFDEYHDFLTNNPIWVGRNKGIGVMTPEQAIAWGTTGPNLRSTGVAHDLRKTSNYLPYDQVSFDVAVGKNGDCYDRYLVRMQELHESLKICEQALEKMPDGDFRTAGKLVPPPRNRLPVSMEAVIHHFKLYTDGPHVPAGEVYIAVESPRGELGYYVASDGRGRPWRLHIRGPSFHNLQIVPEIAPGYLLADLIAILATLDPVMGDVDR
ncbi:MAG: NADH-quinone oxidoreductase subunit D [Actinomycetota bacterium]